MCFQARSGDGVDFPFESSYVGVRAVTTREWLKIACNANGENLHEAIHNQSGYRGISAPATLSHRYGVSVRVMEGIIRLACIIHRTDYWLWGRTLERLGIEHLSVSELTRYVNVKTKHQMPIYARRPKLTPISVTHVEQARKINGRRLLEKAPLPSGSIVFRKQQPRKTENYGKLAVPREIPNEPELNNQEN